MTSKGRKTFIQAGGHMYVQTILEMVNLLQGIYPKPSLFLMRHNELQARPKKRRKPAKHKMENVKIRKLNGNQVSVSPSEKFTDLTQEYEIKFYTGLIN